MTITVDPLNFVVLILVPALLGLLAGWHFGSRWERWYWSDLIHDGYRYRMRQDVRAAATFAMANHRA